MQMTEVFASAVTVTIPILALAAGAEARGIRERIKKPDEAWEREFAEYKAEHELDTGLPPTQVLQFFKGVPGLSKLYFVERLMAIAGALVWLLVFILLTIVELLCLAWLGDGDPAGNSALAVLSLVSIGIAMAALIMTPTLYFVVPLLMPLDLIPHGLKETLNPELKKKSSAGFVKLVFRELEGALDRAGDRWGEEQEARAASDGEAGRHTLTPADSALDDRADSGADSDLAPRSTAGSSGP
jgi:hypothetical protein